MMLPVVLSIDSAVTSSEPLLPGDLQFDLTLWVADDWLQAQRQRLPARLRVQSAPQLPTPESLFTAEPSSLPDALTIDAAPYALWLSVGACPVAAEHLELALALLHDESEVAAVVFAPAGWERLRWLHDAFAAGCPAPLGALLVRRSALQSLGGPRPGPSGWQRVESALRLLLHAEVRHIPLTDDFQPLGVAFGQSPDLLLLEPFRGLPPATLLALFPAAADWLNDSDDVDYALARSVLDADSGALQRWFAIMLLRDCLVDPLRAAALAHASGFDAAAFARLCQRVDPLAERALGLLETRVDAAERALVAARAERSALVDEYEQSRSWRMTAPFRSAVFAARRARAIAATIRLSVGRNGGLGPFLGRGVLLLREQGVAGLRHRLSVLLSARNDYRQWVQRYDTLQAADRDAMRDAVAAMRDPPTIAVLMPTYNPNPQWLAEAIESVQQQLYPHWQLCIADDASTDPAVREVLERFAASDARIRVVYREVNGHISAASNSALTLVTCDWVALLDHDDKLAEHALYHVAQVIMARPNVALIYSDEDKIGPDGERRDPYFKPDWNYPLMLSHNLVTHLGVYRKSVLDRIGGFRSGYDGSQDYDLVLRMIELISPEQIHHIPLVLYHWRIHPDSTAESGGAKPYTVAAGERALNEHFSRQGVTAHVEPLAFGYRPCFALPDPAPRVSVIIPTRNAQVLVEQCLHGLYANTDYPDLEVLLIDNGSDDPQALAAFQSACERYPTLRCLRDDGPFNFSRLNNAAVPQATGEVLCFLNNDIEVVSRDWLQRLVALACQPWVGAAGPKLLYPDGTVQHGGIVLGIAGWAGHGHKGFPADHPGNVGRAALMSAFSAVTGACMVIRKDRFLAVDGFDEPAFGVACNDVDLCLRLRRQGYLSVFDPSVVLTHHESATRGYEDTPEKEARFAGEVAEIWARWGEWMADDPCYNPNLGLDYEDFGLAWPPRQRALQRAAEEAS